MLLSLRKDAIIWPLIDDWKGLNFSLYFPVPLHVWVSARNENEPYSNPIQMALQYFCCDQDLLGLVWFFSVFNRKLIFLTWIVLWKVPAFLKKISIIHWKTESTWLFQSLKLWLLTITFTLEDHKACCINHCWVSFIKRRIDVSLKYCSNPILWTADKLC